MAASALAAAVAVAAAPVPGAAQNCDDAQGNQTQQEGALHIHRLTPAQKSAPGTAPGTLPPRQWRIG